MDFENKGRLTSASLLLAALLSCSAGAERLGDFDGDGKADVLLRHTDGSWRYHAMDGVSVALSAPIRMTPKPEWYWAGAGDFNGDGRDDVMLRRDDGVWVYYPLDGSRVIVEERGWANMTRKLDWRVAGVGDLNGDGRDDMLLRRTDGAWVYYPMNGRRVIVEERGWANLPRDTDWRMAGVGDFDGDGRADVLLRHRDGQWRSYAMSGRRVATRQGTQDLPEALAWRLLTVGDFDGEERADVLLRHADGRWRYQAVAVGAAARVVEYQGDWEWRFAAGGDFNGDGADDVLVRHRDGRWRLDLMAAGYARRDAEIELPNGSIWRVPAPPVYVPDANLRAAVADALGRDSEHSLARRHELAELVHLRAEVAAIAELAGLENATSLQTLELRRNNVEDASPLMGLVRLTDVDLDENRIADLTPFVGLEGLFELALSRNLVSDLSPLSGLAGLRRLWLVSNRVSDLAPLASLVNLEFLYLGANPIEDLSPLTALTKLTRLYLENTGHTDISSLAGLTLIETLSLANNGITDIGALADMTRLHVVFLQGNEIRDLSPLSRALHMAALYLRDNLIEDISLLAEFTELQQLFLERNRVRSVTALARLDHLKYLHLSGNRIRSVVPLANLESLRSLKLDYNEIVDISSLADLRALEILDLAHNVVVDVAALSGLTALERLDLSYNRITDLSPLADNGGLDDGDQVDVRGNPLSEESSTTVVPALVARGVHVRASPPFRPDLVHDDSVLILQVGEDISAETLYTGLPLDLYATTLYTHFEDVFDFVMFFSNLDDIDEHQNARYYGVYSSVRDDTAGVGLRTFYDNRYGSPEKLKGVIHFPYNRALRSGPSLHEMLHAWANFAVPTAVGGHWGFSSAAGQLGGFEHGNLVELGDGRYAAGRFGTFANGGNRPAYSPIELYFAGYIPPEEVPDLWVAADGEWVVEDGSDVRTEDGHAVFSANDVKTYSIEDIVAKNGARVPSMADAQWHFRVAVVLLTDDDHPATTEQLDLLSQHAAWFSLPEVDEHYLHNFFEATGGRGSVTMSGLSQYRKAAPAAVEDLPASYGVVPEPRATLIDGQCLPLSAAPSTVQLRSADRQFFFVGE